MNTAEKDWIAGIIWSGITGEFLSLIQWTFEHPAQWTGGFTVKNQDSLSSSFSFDRLQFTSFYHWIKVTAMKWTTLLTAMHSIFSVQCTLFSAHWCSKKVSAKCKGSSVVVGLVGWYSWTSMKKKLCKNMKSSMQRHNVTYFTWRSAPTSPDVQIRPQTCWCHLSQFWRELFT